MNVKDYVLQAIASFDADPADSPFQRGYEDAMRTILLEAEFPAEDAAVQIAEEAFRAGWEASGRTDTYWPAWCDYEPSEAVKELIP